MIQVDQGTGANASFTRARRVASLLPWPGAIMKLPAFAALFASLVIAACTPREVETSSGGAEDGGAGGGSGGSTMLFTTTTGSGAGAGSSAGTQDCTGLLHATIRDFSPTTHPDFEAELGDDTGIVEAALGADGKPVYTSSGGTSTTHGKAAFDEWFRDTPGVNVSIPTTIQLSPAGGGVYTYDNQAYFPIDGQGLGDEGNPHNYHFTLEVHTQFEYRGGEVFTFTGDDDLFTFINGKLAIDLGGVHGAESSSVDLDASAKELGIEVGKVYTLDLFFAERHTVDSHFRIDTTIACFSQVATPE